ncbi:MAG: NAD-dependent epimerase/dehydratase family protein [Verrucomicrobia bacterium]|nr:NAD-dependent epimerase/dehydratase family protein [Verrucomicrobiota bacterium]
MARDARIYVAGHGGLVGSAIWRELEREGFRCLLGRTRRELDLMDGAAVGRFFAAEPPEFVFVAAARVGGIQANHTQPAEFLYENLQIQNHLVHAAWQSGVRKLLFLGSSCIYPKLAPQPMKEEHLLTGPLEPTPLRVIASPNVPLTASPTCHGEASVDRSNNQFQSRESLVIDSGQLGLCCRLVKFWHARMIRRNWPSFGALAPLFGPHFGSQEGESGFSAPLPTGGDAGDVTACG